jgi:hypothetical protein
MDTTWRVKGYLRYGFASQILSLRRAALQGVGFRQSVVQSFSRASCRALCRASCRRADAGVQTCRRADVKMCRRSYGRSIAETFVETIVWAIVWIFVWAFVWAID